MTTLANCSAKMMALLHILKMEGKFLRAGELAEIQPIIETKSKAMQDVESAMAALDNPDTLDQLRSYIMALDKMGKENGRLLQAVLAGARAARTRIDSLQSQAAQVGTYDSSGKKHNISGLAKTANKMV